MTLVSVNSNLLSQVAQATDPITGVCVRHGHQAIEGGTGGGTSTTLLATPTFGATVTTLLEHVQTRIQLLEQGLLCRRHCAIV